MFGGDSKDLDLSGLNIHLAPGDSITITALVSGGAGSDASSSMTWYED